MDLFLVSEPKKQRLLDKVEQIAPPGSDSDSSSEDEMEQTTPPGSDSEDEMKPVFIIGESSKKVPRIEGFKRSKFPLPLIEVFSVRILNLSGSGSHIYGAITISDGSLCTYLYNRKKEESETFFPGQPVLLTGPLSSICALDSIFIGVDLMDRDDDHAVSHQGLPSNYKYAGFLWDDCLFDDLYDLPLYKEVKGKYYTVGLSYTVFEDAAQATVDVTLIIRDPKHTPNVFGSITAINSNSSEDQVSVLFHKTLHEHIDVRSGELIPLSRSVVSVPLNSVLIVRADLEDYYGAGGPNLEDYGASGVIAKGSAEFPANLSGEFFEKLIPGKDSEIRVKVTWPRDTADRYK